MASRDGTLVVRQNVPIVDAAGNSWSLRNGQVYQNGVVDPFTSRVVALGYSNGQIVQMNASKLWWAKTGNGWGGWNTPGNADGHIALPIFLDRPPIVIQASTAPIIDRAGNLWWIDNGKVVQNGVADRFTGNVVAIAMGNNGEIYQQNSAHLWWQKTGQGWGGWGTPGTPDGHITFDPIATSLSGISTPLWLGGPLGGNNDGAQATNWSLGTKPAPGTTAYMIAGTLNVANDALNGATIATSGTFGSPQETTINLSGTNHLRVTNAGQPGAGAATVNLAQNAQWIGGFDAVPFASGVIVQGPGKFANTASTASHNSAIVNADVVGAGTFTIAASRADGKIEFMRSVSPEQSVSLGRALGYGNRAILQVDSPQTFDASVKLGAGDVIMKSLQADSYAFKNDLLSMYKNGAVVDTVPLTLTPSSGQFPDGAVNFGVSQIDSDVVIHATSDTYGGTLLPQIA